jgi:hypothetical protein
MNKNNDEADLAKGLTVGMNTYLDGRGMRGALDKTDISVRRISVLAAPGPSVDLIVLLLEAGIFGDSWWGQVHQVFSYAELVCKLTVKVRTSPPCCNKARRKPLVSWESPENNRHLQIQICGC